MKRTYKQRATLAIQGEKKCKLKQITREIVALLKLNPASLLGKGRIKSKLFKRSCFYTILVTLIIEWAQEQKPPFTQMRN